MPPHRAFCGDTTARFDLLPRGVRLSVWGPPPLATLPPSRFPYQVWPRPVSSLRVLLFRLSSHSSARLAGLRNVVRFSPFLRKRRRLEEAQRRHHGPLRTPGRYFRFRNRRAKRAGVSLQPYISESQPLMLQSQNPEPQARNRTPWGMRLKRAGFWVLGLGVGAWG